MPQGVYSEGQHAGTCAVYTQLMPVRLLSGEGALFCDWVVCFEYYWGVHEAAKKEI